MFCVPELVFDGTDGVGSRLNVLRALTHFQRCRVRRDPFSCYTPVVVFSGTEGVGSCFMFWARGLIFGGTDGVGSRFHVLRYRTRFRRY
jgi:hypothetical protein